MKIFSKAIEDGLVCDNNNPFFKENGKLYVRANSMTISFSCGRPKVVLLFNGKEIGEIDVNTSNFTLNDSIELRDLDLRCEVRIEQ